MYISGQAPILNGQIQYTGKVGDGIMFVFGLEEVVRIRTGETGVDAV